MPSGGREIVVGKTIEKAPEKAPSTNGKPGESERLDHFLGRELGLSLRGTRRFFGEHVILVNGRRARPGTSVAPGDTVRIEESDESLADTSPANGAVPHPQVRLLQRDEDFAFFEKPALLHTESLAGRANDSVQKEISRLLPGASFARLLQRLDFETSGLLACALCEESVERFRALEAEGSIEKRYLAVLSGRLEESVVVKNRLEGRGKRVATLDFDDPATARHTSFTPLMFLEKDAALVLFGETIEATLAGCLIRRGARHQIRAHAAEITHPLIYDAVYGPIYGGASFVDAKRTGHFLLHHARLSFAGYALESLPAWLSLIPGADIQARKWFAQKSLVT